jgi:Carboxypeptidase regulatory-like domain
MRSLVAFPTRMSTVCALVFTLMAWAVLGTANSHAQITDATILGTVVDPSGAVIPGATVTTTNELTGFSRSATTGTDGTFLIQFLPIGTMYRVEAQHNGFKTEIKRGISLQVGENARVDIRLEIGELTQKVEVTTAVPLIDTYSATKGEVVDSLRLTELPLNGRSPLQLASTVAGATVVSVPIDLSGGGRDGAYINVNGSIKESMDQQLDGIRFAGAYSNSGLDYPNPDALAEFKLITNPLSAEYGMWSGAVFTAVVKSGTNEIHGSAFEFLRNTDLNARNYFSPTNNPYHQNQFGVNAGGPVLRNRLFWFGSYQGLRISQQAIISSVPLTADERQGIITSSTPVKNPLTGLPFSQNDAGQYVIPMAQFDPVATYLLNKFIPVAPVGQSTIFTTSASTNNADQAVAKIDYNISKSDQLSGMFFYERVVPLNAFPTGPYAGYGSYKASGPQSDLAISETHTFGPSLINEARFGFAAQQETRSELNGTSPATMGINGWDYDYWYQNNPKTPMVSPAISVAGRFAMGDYGGNNWIEGGANWQGSDFVTLLKGKHNMKMGADFYRRQHHLDVDEVQTGDFGFDGTVSGNPTADFLLGSLGSALRIQYVFNPGYESWSRMFFYQDDWKVSRNLTLNLGLRYELHEPFKEYRANSSQYHLGVPGFGTFDFAAYEAGVHSTVFPYAPAGMVYPGDKTPDFPNGVPSTLIPTDKKQIQPRLGFAWDPWGNGKTAIRGSAGLFTDALSAWSTSFAGNNLPYIAINSNPDPPGTLSNPYVGLTPFPQVSAKNIATDPGFFQLQSDATS